MKPKYIVLEGPGCAGKGTQLAFLADWLETEKEVKVVTTREPGGPAEAELIREEIFRLKALGELSQADEIEMFYLAREISMAWVEQQIENGFWVLKDRDYVSTWHFQAETGVPEHVIRRYHQQLYVDKGLREPDLRVVLTVNKEVLLERMTQRGTEGDVFDNDLRFAMAVSHRYGEMACDILRGKGRRWGNTVMVDGNGPVEVVSRSVKTEVASRLGLKDEEVGKEVRHAFGTQNRRKEHWY